MEVVSLPKVAVLGIGLMGNKIARRLVGQGFTVIAWNRTSCKAAALNEAGILHAHTVAEACQTSDVIILMLADFNSIQTTIISDPDAMALLSSKTVVQMGTIGPHESKILAAEFAKLGVSYLEAPVLGSQPEAVSGTLIIMVGCEGNPYSSPAWPVLKALGKDPSYQGPVGTASGVKLALNHLIAVETIGFSTSLSLVQESNADVEKFMSILRSSALYAPTFDKKLAKMLSHDYKAANFPTKHLLKDVKLFRDEAQANGINTRLPEALESVINKTIAAGLGDVDYSSVYEGVCSSKKDCS